MANGPRGGVKRSLLGGVVGLVKALRVGIGRRWAALARSEDEFCRGFSAALNEKHVAAGAV